jgi:hypothetical protein
MVPGDNPVTSDARPTLVAYSPQSMSDPNTPTPAGGRPRSTASPNYAARRMLVTTVAIMAVVAFGVVGWRAVRGDDAIDGSTGGTWSEIAFVDRSSGEVLVLDDSGEPTRTMPGQGAVTDAYALGDRLALVGPTTVAVAGGDAVEPIAIGRTNTVTPIRTPGTLHLVIGTASGGNVTILDVATGDVLDVGALADQTDPRLFAETIRWSSDGSRFAVADAGFFRTIVVESGAEGPGFFGAQPLALDDDLIATSQVIALQADVALVDRERTNKALVPTEIPAGAVMVDHELLMVATTGTLYRISDGDTEAERLGDVAVPTGATVSWVSPTLDGSRLVVVGAVFQAVIDLDGETLFTTTFANPIEIDAPRPDWRCLPIGGDATFHSIVDLDTGEQIADLSGVEVTGVSGDGCAVIGTRGGVAEVISAEGTVEIGAVRTAVLAPDGRAVVRTTPTGTTELVRIEDDLTLGEPIDLSDVVSNNAIVAFLG